MSFGIVRGFTATASVLMLASVHAQIALPSAFEANQGQTGADVKFLSRGPGYTVFLTPREHVLETGTSSVRFVLDGASPRAKLSGIDPLAGASHYLIGSDPSRWHTGVARFAKVKYTGVYPGIDLVYYGNPCDLEYDFIVAPGADPRVIAFSLEGARKMKITPQGDLILGAIRLHRPVIYQESNGGRRPIAGGYVVRGHRVRFRVAAYDRTRPLIIDPSISFSTYLGGNGTDFFSSMQVDSAGNIYVTGTTNSTNFPTSAGALRTTAAGGRDAFVTKLAPDGKTVTFSTYLGGSADEFGSDLAIGSDGSIYVAGVTASKDFPVVNANQATLPTTQSGGSSGFLSRLKPDGSGLMFSTYFGGSGTDFFDKIAVGSDGSAYLIGITRSANFPVKGPFETGATPSNSTFVGFVTKFSATGSVVYASLMGFGNEQMGGITVDASGNAYVVGETPSSKFPVTAGAFMTTPPGPTPGFVSKINPAGSALVWSTFLGGSGGDFPCCVALDSVGNVFVAGNTTSANFPTLNPLQAKNAGKNDAFLTIVKPDGSGLLASTFYGGNGDEIATDLALVNGTGGIILAGNEGGTLAGAGPPPNSNNSVSLVRIDGFFSTPSGNVTAIVSGTTNSTNLPLSNPVQPALGTACPSQPCTTNFATAFNVSGVGPLMSAQAFRSPAGIATFNLGNATTQGSGKNNTPAKSGPLLGCSSLTVTPDSATLPPTSLINSGGFTISGSVNIAVATQANCAWSASVAPIGGTPPDWLTLVNPAGSGPSNFVIKTVKDNGNGQIRGATVNVNGNGGSATIAVTQEAAGCTYAWTPDDTSIDLGLAGGDQLLKVTTQPGCTWTASAGVVFGSPSSGVTVSPTSGTGSGTANVVIGAANPIARLSGVYVTGGLFVITQQAPPALPPNSTVNGSFNPNASPSPGGIASTFGTNLAPDTMVASSIPLPTSLLGASVSLTTSAGKSINAPLFFVSPGQINFQLPWEVAGQTTTTVTVTTGTQSSTAQPLTLGPVGPGIFAINGQGTGQGAITNAVTGAFAAPTGSIPGAAAAPVHVGDFITIYANGLGPVTNAPASGAAGPSNPLANTTQAVTVTVGGVSVPASFSGLAPGFVGLCQVNAQIPSGVAAGSAVQLTISVGGMTSNVVTIAVQ